MSLKDEIDALHRIASRRTVTPEPGVFDRERWPVPERIKSASARDAFLWYVIQAWPTFMLVKGDETKPECLLDHDFGLHIWKLGSWELRLVNTEQFPADAFGVGEDA